MAQITKYRAKYVYWDVINGIVLGADKVEKYRTNGKLKLPEYIWRFDSQHEFKVYLELARIFGSNRVIRQLKLRIMPASSCFPSGKHWRVDFGILNESKDGGYCYYIEAKGACLPEFTNILANLELFNRIAFNHLWIVFAEQVPTENKVIKALTKTTHTSRLLTLKELKQLTTLE